MEEKNIVLTEGAVIEIVHAVEHIILKLIDVAFGKTES